MMRDMRSHSTMKIPSLLATTLAFSFSALAAEFTVTQTPTGGAVVKVDGQEEDVTKR